MDLSSDSRSFFLPHRFEPRREAAQLFPRTSHSLFGLPPLGDVHLDPVHRRGLPVVIESNSAKVADPPHGTVRTDDAVLEVEILPTLKCLGHR